MASRAKQCGLHQEPSLNYRHCTTAWFADNAGSCTTGAVVVGVRKLNGSLWQLLLVQGMWNRAVELLLGQFSLAVGRAAGLLSELVHRMEGFGWISFGTA